MHNGQPVTKFSSHRSKQSNMKNPDWNKPKRAYVQYKQEKMNTISHIHKPERTRGDSNGEKNFNKEKPGRRKSATVYVERNSLQKLKQPKQNKVEKSSKLLNKYKFEEENYCPLKGNQTAPLSYKPSFNPQIASHRLGNNPNFQTLNSVSRNGNHSYRPTAGTIKSGSNRTRPQAQLKLIQKQTQFTQPLQNFDYIRQLQSKKSYRQNIYDKYEEMLHKKEPISENKLKYNNFGSRQSSSQKTKYLQQYKNNSQLSNLNNYNYPQSYSQPQKLLDLTPKLSKQNFITELANCVRPQSIQVAPERYQLFPLNFGSINIRNEPSQNHPQRLSQLQLKVKQTLMKKEVYNNKSLQVPDKRILTSSIPSQSDCQNRLTTDIFTKARFKVNDGCRSQEKGTLSRSQQLVEKSKVLRDKLNMLSLQNKSKISKSLNNRQLHPDERQEIESHRLQLMLSAKEKEKVYSNSPYHKIQFSQTMRTKPLQNLLRQANLCQQQNWLNNTCKVETYQTILKSEEDCYVPKQLKIIGKEPKNTVSKQNNKFSLQKINSIIRINALNDKINEKINSIIKQYGK